MYVGMGADVYVWVCGSIGSVYVSIWMCVCEVIVVVVVVIMISKR